MSVHSAVARARANLALVKYFGKRDLTLNLPAAGSLSLTLDPLLTETEVAFDDTLDSHRVELDGAAAPEKFARRAGRFLDIVRELAGDRRFARVTTRNDFPTAAGLASSASGFAALAVAATKALGLELDDASLSALARRGSGSAARSIPGGISVWRAGTEPDGSDSFAASILSPDDWDLRVVVGVTDPGPKAIGSSEAMESTRLSSDYYASWIQAVEVDLEAAIGAVARRDFTALGETTEHSALAMHAAALAARPGILYWKGPTVEAIHLARRLRKNGVESYFTCDAGPQPKLVCREADEQKVATALESLPGIVRLIRCRLGRGAELVPAS